MLVIRPIQQGDFADLLQIAEDSGVGFTSLPVNEELLQKKIAASIEACTSHPTKAGDQSYLFVMEDTDTKEIVGTTGIEATVGLNEAFYHYHIGKVIHSSRELQVYKTADVLTLCNDYTGVSEICTLFLQKHARKGLAGRLLSKSRFLFMAQHPHRFADTVIAEMRGISDNQGHSPFWEWLKEHFFSIDFPTADYLTGIGSKEFIAELMPKYPIYINLLPKDAQAVIGEVHEQTRPALHLLEKEGFRCRRYVDIFDAGPTLEADVANIATAKQSFLAKVVVKPTLSETDTTPYYAINTQVKLYRAGVLNAKLYNDEIIIDQATADAMLLKNNDNVRLASTTLAPE